MTTVKPIDFFAALYPEEVRPGQLMLCSEIRRSGRRHTDWCYELSQAARWVEKYRLTREVGFGVALQDRQLALAQARRRLKRATAARVWGFEGSVVVLPALWVEIKLAGGVPAAGDPPDRAAALRAFAAAPKPPSILVWTGDAFEGYWLLRRRWILRSDEDRRRARDLLDKLQWALAGAAAEPWRVDRGGGLARRLRVPGAFHSRRPGSPRRPVVVEQFPLVDKVDRWRYRRLDFESLPEPPVGRVQDPPWDDGPRIALPQAPPADFRAIWRGCSWLRHCHRDQPSLSEAEWRWALSVVGRSEDRWIDGQELARRFSRGHPGYTPEATAEELVRALGPRSGPASCRRVAEDLGAWDDHCASCPHQGLIEGPLDLGRRGREGASSGREAASGPPPLEKGELEGDSPGTAGDSPGTEGDSPDPVFQVEVVLRAAVPTAPSADDLAAPWPDLIAAAIAGLTAGRPADGRVGQGPPDGGAAADGAAVELLAGLEELLAAVGGEATSHRIVGLLAVGENRRRFDRLCSALRRLYPGFPGGVPTTRELGQRLRRRLGRPAGGRELVRGQRTSEGVLWAVRRTPPVPPPVGGETTHEDSMNLTQRR